MFKTSHMVGPGVRAVYDITTGKTVIKSLGGGRRNQQPQANEHTLDADWLKIMGVNKKMVTSIHVQGEKIYLPENSCGIFGGLENMSEITLDKFDTSRVKIMVSMFENAHALKKIDLSHFDMSNVNTVAGMFSHCTNLAELEIGSMNTSKVGCMRQMFCGCFKLRKIDLSRIDVSQVWSMEQMFRNCYALEEIDLHEQDMKALQTTKGMFSRCAKLKKADFSGWHAPKLIDANGMFEECRNLRDISMYGTNSMYICDMSAMFADCNDLENVNLGNTTPKTTYAEKMFRNCVSLTSLDLSGIDVSEAKTMNKMFAGCKNLLEVKMNTATDAGTDTRDMFKNCPARVI